MSSVRILRHDPASENEVIHLITELSHIEYYIEDFYFELIPDLKLCEDLSILYNEIFGYNYIGTIPPGEEEFDMNGRLAKLTKIRNALKKLLGYDELEEETKQILTYGIKVLKTMVNSPFSIGVGLTIHQ